MILKAVVGLFVCGVVGSAVVALVLPSDQAALEAVLSVSVPTMSSHPSDEEFQKGESQKSMTQARIAAERPFAVLSRTVR
jgi:hypothetical protein